MQGKGVREGRESMVEGVREGCGVEGVSEDCGVEGVREAGAWCGWRSGAC